MMGALWDVLAKARRQLLRFPQRSLVRRCSLFCDVNIAKRETPEWDNLHVAATATGKNTTRLNTIPAFHSEKTIVEGITSAENI